MIVDEGIKQVFMEKQLKPQVVILGGGLTGLTLAFLLHRRQVDFILIEKSARAGGVIQTSHRDGFTFETGPNTGIIAHPEVVELFEMLTPNCEIELANPKAENRWILKGGKWQPLPSGLIAGIKTPLFSLKDKFRILAEPFRKKGTDPLETIAELVKRRMGQSFLDYAVDPFISGIYAGDPNRLVTKYALPKLYALEQNYGSFIKGGIRKAREPKTERDRKATRKVFAAKGGFQQLISALVNEIPAKKIIYNAEDVKVSKVGDAFSTKFNIAGGNHFELNSQQFVSTVGGHALSKVFDFIEPETLKPITELEYARVVQVIMAFNKWNGPALNAFGGLVPSKEKRSILGVLFPSSIFKGRTPEGGTLLSIFLGGVKRPEIYDLSDEKLLELVHAEMNDLLQTNQSKLAFIEIHRYKHAIPQYGKYSPERLSSINEIETRNPGLILAGNIRDGIGIADRIKQAKDIARVIENGGGGME